MDPLEPRSTREEEEYEAGRDEYWEEIDRLEALEFRASYEPEPLLNPERWVDDLPF